jgi:hypothetical protein
MQLSDKTVWTGIGVVFLALFWFWEPDQFNESFRAMMGVAYRMVLLAFAAAFAYQAYDALRSGITGTQPKASKPDDDPTAWSARFGGIAWGTICVMLSTVTAGFALGLLGRFP